MVVLLFLFWGSHFACLRLLSLLPASSPKILLKVPLLHDATIPSSFVEGESYNVQRNSINTVDVDGS